MAKRHRFLVWVDPRLFAFIGGQDTGTFRGSQIPLTV